ncbi:MAG: SMC family ATPase [Candidatus Melainabacteria bacterium]|nr:SMC family ATPase [Candidatus Melainabacteria bacterium]
MILRTLTLHNFMSYAHTTLDLDSVAVACLSGSNGSGKSALLDAVTWAIWEAARSGSDELIRIGESEMRVEVVFDYEGRTFKIIRSRQRRMSRSGGAGSSKGNLEFQVLESSTSAVPALVGAQVGLSEGEANVEVNAFAPGQKRTWRSLTGASMRHTQQAICQLLRMDFDTFVNSAYLKQGRGDEFTTRQPAERKQVLSEILGLSYFDRMQEASRQKAKELKMRLEFMEGELIKIDELEERLKETDQQKLVAQEELDSTLKEWQSLDQSRSDIKNKMEQQRFKAERSRLLLQQSQEIEVDVLDLKGQVEKNLKEEAHWQETLSQSSFIEEQARLFIDTRKAVEELDQKSILYQGLKEEKIEFQSKLVSLRNNLEYELKHIEQEISEFNAKQTLLKQDTAGKEKTQQAYNEYKLLVEQELALSIKQDEYMQLSSREKELQSVLLEAKLKLQAELEQKKSALEELKKVIESAKTFDQERLSLEDEAKALDKLEAEFELVEQEGISLKSQIETIELQSAEYQRHQKECQRKIDELEKNIETSICPLCSGPIVDKVKVIDKYKQDIKGMNSQRDELVIRQQELIQARDNMRNKYKDLKASLAGRKEFDTRIGAFNQKEKAIGESKQSLTKLETDLDTIEKKLETGNFAQVERSSLAGIQVQLQELDFDPFVFTNLQSELRQRRHIEAKHQKLEKDLATLKANEEKFPELIVRLSAIKEELEIESYGQEWRQKLLENGKKIEELAYDRELHLKLKSQLGELMIYEQKAQELSRANLELPKIRLVLQENEGRLSVKQSRLDEIKTELEELSKFDQFDEQAQNLDLSELERRIKDLEMVRDEKSKACAVFDNSASELAKELVELNKKKDAQKELLSEREDYVFLSEAFGKKGIQALIIETAIPEIEAEANRVLARLSDNKMHVGLITQAKTKSGNNLETLEILIGDEVGTRSYELYSGGEAFKVNFAIRIALSRLLARRAGARLETLIIDEGFGSQDEYSRDKLVKSIKAIQSDFAKILVITHIPDVREMFPVQIQVTKESGISSLQIV